MSNSPTNQNVNVRNIISIFENQSSYVHNESNNLIRRAKSMQNLSFSSSSKKPVEYIELEQHLELAQIEQQFRHLQNNLNNYKTYSRDSHIYYQNQIIFILTDIANINTVNDPTTTDHKTDLMESLKRLNKKLNTLLPSPGVGGSSATHVTRVNKDVIISTRSKSIDEGRKEIYVNKQEPVSRDEYLLEKTEQRRVIGETEKIEEAEAPALSVRSLKKIFETNATSIEGKSDFGATKISRKFLTFNGTSDLKYVPYSEKYKLPLDAEFSTRNRINTQISLNIDSVDGVVDGVDDEKDSGSSSDESEVTDSQEIESIPEELELEVD